MSNMNSPLPQCASMVRIQNILSGKWKITILWYIAEYKVQRFGELRWRLGDITQSTLTKQLRELEQDGFVSRYVYQEVPPKVEYSLTDLGKSFVPILQDMKKWSDIHLMWYLGLLCVVSTTASLFSYSTIFQLSSLCNTRVGFWVMTIAPPLSTWTVTV